MAGAANLRWAGWLILAAAGGAGGGPQIVPLAVVPQPVSVAQPASVRQPAGPELSATAMALLRAHNAERARLGVPLLEWDAQLADAATQWAKALAQSRQLAHSPEDLRAGQGENLFAGTAGYYRPAAMVEAFLAEGALFKPGRFPDVAQGGSWRDVGHYTQLVWRKTRKLGCGLARGGGQDYLVCRYYPAGNIIGQKVL